MVRTVRLVRYANEAGRTWGPGRTAQVPSLAEGVKQSLGSAGPPSQIIDGIKSIEANTRVLEDFMIHWAEGLPPDEFKEQLRLVRRDVAGVQSHLIADSAPTIWTRALARMRRDARGLPPAGDQR